MTRSSAKTRRHSAQSRHESAPAHQGSASVHSVEPPTDPHSGRAAHNQSQSQLRALRHNSEAHQNEHHPDTPAGQHATGSFTTESVEHQKSK